MIDLDIGNVINILPRLLTDKLSEAEAAQSPHVVFCLHATLSVSEYRRQTGQHGSVLILYFASQLYSYTDDTNHLTLNLRMACRQSGCEI